MVSALTYLTELLDAHRETDFEILSSESGCFWEIRAALSAIFAAALPAAHIGPVPVMPCPENTDPN
jgi:hypothetical protein